MAKYEKVTDNAGQKTVKLSISELSTKVRDYHIRLLYNSFMASDLNITKLSCAAIIINLLYEDANRFNYTYLNANNIEGNIQSLIGRISSMEEKSHIISELNTKQSIQDGVRFFADKFFGVINPNDTLDGRMSYYGKVSSIIAGINL